MLIKLNLEGELLEALLQDSKDNCRTRPQQIIYILKKYYEGTEKYQQGTNKCQQGTNIRLESTNKVLTSTVKYQDSTELDQDSTENSKYLDQIGTDILDF